MKPVTQFIVTGATGLVGGCVVAEARRLFPDLVVTEIKSARSGGVDLTEPEAWQKLVRTVAVPLPEQAAVIHCAADLSLEGPAVGANNSAMTRNVARWTKEAGLGFAVYVSSVSVYQPREFTEVGSPVGPPTPYGESKLAGESLWEDGAIVRLAGVLGWQAQPQMFWNRLLLRALATENTGGQYKPGAARNYITGPEVAECLIRIAINRATGLHLAAGLETVTLGEYVSLLEQAVGRSLGLVAIDGAPDRVIYEPSFALAGWLKPFTVRFAELWAQRPNV